ncbi:Cellulase M-related protein [Archaeoglobus sulfaticallidus PM70-1]|uniref:Cellulase M-related protein n=1 Tax=Archaeoglobus sulfaticallidus PM70-1 TaxID=387631 RepID=N0BIB0_9EURY|nr:M42 family metallopeptidase [Archaeoglobus sulfaticallidus]AGK60201.1 Cellulase M-related protein [Archaeoglobus sulfaticallidus PM70-1]
MEDVKELLRKLSNAHGVSGFEDDVREVVKAELEDHVDEIRIDSMGNIICVKNGNEFTEMIASHIDEIGFIVKYIDDRGYIRFAALGGWFDQTALNQRVVLHGSKGNVYGVIGCKPPHLMRDDERKKVIQIKDMFIDVGAGSKEEVQELGIDIGTPITIDREFRELGNNKVTGKAFDNRAGTAVMIEALKNTESKATIFAVGTVQEEVGLKGARISAFAIEPDVAIATDVCVAVDFPGTESAYMDVKLGNGPAITVVDASGRGLIASKRVIEWLKGTAERYEIPYQMEVAEGGTTDATAIHLTKSGIPTGVVSVPARYIHSPVEVIDVNDVVNSAKLVARSLETAEEYFRSK